ncbi:Sensor protein of zinc sigma-54-dependent two-component system [Minicystis rosea]|nr:Sensor protein of zinc sigma-54-dependent two-component system [Minicystis rosea]
MSNIRTQTTLVCGALAIAIAVSAVLRGRVRPVHLLFAGFAADIGLWYLSQSAFFGLSQSPGWQTAIVILAVALPQFALRLFEAMVPHEDGHSPRLLRVATLLLVVMVPLVALLPLRPEGSPILRVSIFFYVFALLTAGLYTLGQRGLQSPSRDTQRRVRFLVVIGAAAGLASLFDFAWFLTESLGWPPVGAVLSIVFLFLLAEALRHERLLDLYELLARLLVATAVAFLIALIFYFLAVKLGQFRTMYLNVVLAAIVIILIFDPLRERVEGAIQRFFRERFDLESSIALLRRRLVHILEVDEMAAMVMAGLDQSRRVTAAGLYLRDQDGTGFDLLASLGSRVPRRLEVATSRALLDRLEQGPLALEEVERDTRDRRARDERDDAGEAVLAAAAVLGHLRHGVVIAVRDEAREIIGLLVVTDDRARDAFSPEEAALLGTVAAQIGVVLENSRVYAQMKERDRLAVLGQMAAGLAHEIRNPLGAIKGAAQLLSDPPEGASLDPASREFLGIILEEVDRLDRVVGSVLDLSRSHDSAVVPTDVNAIVRRTIQILSAEPGSEELKVELALEPTLPRVAIDPEQLRQVLMNLLRNAAQAMKGRGKVVVSTRVRFGRGTRSGPGSDEPHVEVTVADNGPGISQKVLENLFMPFFTTKEKGTGLGLAISQRIVQNAGGRIDVRSYEGKGSTFAVILPAAMDALGTPTPSPVAKIAAVTIDVPEPSSKGGSV